MIQIASMQEMELQMAEMEETMGDQVETLAMEDLELEITAETLATEDQPEIMADQEVIF